MNSKHQLALILQFTVTMILFSHSNAAALSVAKPGCEQECGGITIPYPFGIGSSSCYHNQWFEIVCKQITSATTNTRTTAGAKPFLKRVNLEILELRTPLSSDQTGWIYVNNPIVASSPNCSASKTSTSAAVVNLTGSPFYYSHGYNSFGAAGCNNEVWMTGSSQVVGCTSTCNTNTGMGNCCQTAVPSSLRAFKVSFSDPASGCKYGFIARSKWFDSYPSSTCNAALLDLDSVPAWLEWGFYNSTPEAVLLAQQSTRPNSSVGCTYYTYDDGLVVQFCFCSKGFGGNPYLANGCQDIDECADRPSDCKGTCTNTIGSYKCSGANSTVIHVVIIAAGSLVGVMLLIVCIWAILNHIKSRKKKKNFKHNGGLLLSSAENTKITTYSANELKKATNNFHTKNKLGEGGQGTVYRGTLSIDGNGTPVAVKKCKKIVKAIMLKTDQNDAAQEEDDTNMNAFITEVINLSKTKHNNIVKLLGCCLETEAPMLVYEHVANGDLFNHLHNDKNKRDFVLSWESRLRIAAEAAAGFRYLHSDAEVPIYHRDIKSANILLDNKNVAKIADFGISKSVSADQTRVNVVDVVGSLGYTDPEYKDSGQYSDKSDVYSFGVVLAELLTGKKPLLSPDWQDVKDETVTLLARDFESMDFGIMLSSGFLDPVVEKEAREVEIEAVVNLAKQCLKSKGSERPTMKDVSAELERIKKLHKESYSRGANASPINGDQQNAVPNKSSTRPTK